MVLASTQTQITIYTTQWCGYCRRAKAILQNLGHAFEEIPVDHDPEKRAWLQTHTGQRTVPQIFVGKKSIGGCDDLEALIRAGEFDVIVADQVAD